MFGVAIGSALAAAPPAAAVHAMVLDLEQDGMRVEAEVLEGHFGAACEAGWRPACEWEKWRAPTAIERVAKAAEAMRPWCEQDRDPLACVVVGWSLTQSEPGMCDPDLPSAFVGAALFRRARGAGLLRGCAELGALRRRGCGIDRDYPEAVALLRRACDGGVGNACMSLADLVSEGQGVDADPDEAVRLRLHGCEAGDAIACAAAGEDIESGRAKDADPERAFDFYRRACDAGHAEGCAMQAHWLIVADVGQRDREVELLRRACDGESWNACVELGLRVEVEEAGGAQEASALFSRACEHEKPWGCGQLGRSLAGAEPDRSRLLLRRACADDSSTACTEIGLGAFATDPKGGLSFLRRGCSHGSVAACAAVATLQDGVAPPPPDARSLTALREGCARKDAAACLSLGAVLRARLGGLAGQRAATDALQSACDAGSGIGCAIAANQLLAGDIRDTDRAIRDAGPACRAGMGFACTQVGRALLERDRVATEEAKKKDPERQAQVPVEEARSREVREHLRRACERGDADGCQALAEHVLAGEEGGSSRVAIELSLRACDLGLASACRWSGDELAEGRRVSRDLVQAADLLGRACGWDDREACRKLGELNAREVESAAAAVAAFDQGCALGDSKSCTRLGAVLAWGLKVQSDPVRGLAALEQACEDEAWSACALAGAVHEGGWAGSRDVERAAERYERACAHGKSVACTRGILLATAGRLDDWPDAEAYLDSSCASGDGLACAGLGQVDRACRNGFRAACAGAPASVDVTGLGNPLALKAACRDGDGTGCVALGTTLLDLPLPDLAERVALHALESGCDRGEASGCVLAAEMIHAGKGSDAPDPARARDLYERACSNGDARGCVLAARMHDRGDGIARRNETALVRYERACELGDGEACNALAVMRQSGEGRDRARGQALRAYRDGCERGSGLACHNLGLTRKERARWFHGQVDTLSSGFYNWSGDWARGLHRWIGVRANDSFRRGCELGHAPACEELGEAFETGRGVPDDRLEAVHWFSIACRRGPGSACDALARARVDGVALPPLGPPETSLFRRACADEDADSCLLLGLADVDPDTYTESQAAFEKACDEGSAAGCGMAGYRIALHGAPGDPAEANGWLRKACSDGDAVGCGGIGVIDGRANGPSDSLAYSRLLKACLGGLGIACTWQASALVAKDPRPKARRQAARLRVRACRMGHLPACESIATP